MNYYSAWPMIVLFVVLLLIAGTPLFKAADSPPIPTPSRLKTLDGLRGFLALSVFFHHTAAYHNYIGGAPWGPPPDRLYALLGPFGVSMFFMITGFLFWSQILEKKGRPDWLRLYVGRVFRIGPLYWFAVAAMTISVFYLSHFHLDSSPPALAWQLLRWFSLGFWSGIYINGFHNTGLLIGGVWTLRYEWFFYASLLLTALFARRRLTSWLFPAIGLVISLAFVLKFDLEHRESINLPFLALFFVGMLTAALRPFVTRLDFGRPVYSALAGLLLLAVLCLFPTAYASAPICLLAGAFFLIANGATLFGLLTNRAARRLGDISFGIYLLQGIVLSVVFGTQWARNLALSSPISHWSVVAVAMLGLVVLSTVTHAAIERPGVDAGRRALGWLRAKPPFAAASRATVER